MEPTQTPTTPPDKDAEIAMLRMRVHAAEAALYAIEEHVRATLLDGFIQPIVRQMHALAQQFPIGDDSAPGVQNIALNAIRAAMPDMAGKTDEELLQLYFRSTK